jgi:hypothetical protein
MRTKDTTVRQIKSQSMIGNYANDYLAGLQKELEDTALGGRKASQQSLFSRGVKK